jgi:hypothetical protein
MPSTLPSAAELTRRVARCVGIYETNRGGNDPRPRESALDTVAGVHASMATIEQATAPYAVDALARFKALRDAATPPLAPADLAAANDRCKGVVSLIGAVTKASNAGEAPNAFVARSGNMIAKAGLAAGDVATMFLAVALKGEVDALRGQVAQHQLSLDQAAASVKPSERLGLGLPSLKAYIRKAANWGEHRAGWQRKSVRAMPGNVGGRIEAVAVSSQGCALAIPVIGALVDKELARDPSRGAQDIVKAVATANNPGEAGYGDNVAAIYTRLFG